MRIISKFTDYYDSLQYLSDHGNQGPTSDVKSVTSDVRPWIRNTEIIEERQRTSYWRPAEINFIRFWVGFCGQVYLGYDINGTHCYTVEHVDQVIGAMHVRGEIGDCDYKQYLSSTVEKTPWGYRHKNHSRQITWDAAATREAIAHRFLNYPKDDKSSICEDHKTPIYLITHSHVVINPRLADVKFQRVMNAMQAYQEIEMYLGNMCFPEPHINEISDELKAETHGFNKYSFRKDKSKK